jgi:hypothetical protein
MVAIKKKSKKQIKEEMEAILSNIVIMCDTREQENSHITAVFDKCKVIYEVSYLKFGDYSFFSKDTGESFEHNIVIERKNSVDELSQTITKRRKSFEEKMKMAKDLNCRYILLIENGNYNDILDYNYRSKLTVKSFISSLLTYQARYNISIIFMEGLCSANYIYNTFKYFLREKLKEELY